MTRGITRAFFPHGLGHSLGSRATTSAARLTKPRPDTPFLRNTSIIDVGQVFTIEPGIYFIEPLLAPYRAKEASGIDWKLVREPLSALGGVRIEDRRGGDGRRKRGDPEPHPRDLRRESLNLGWRSSSRAAGGTRTLSLRPPSPLHRIGERDEGLLSHRRAPSSVSSLLKKIVRSSPR